MRKTVDRYRAKKVLVTGGAGFIGSRLVNAISRVAEVVVLDDLSSGVRWNICGEGFQFAEGSLLDEALLQGIFETRFDVVFHLAALFANQNSLEHPEKDLAVNGQGTLRLLQHVAHAEVDRFVFTSSSCVYGSAPPPAREEAISIEPDTPYAATKLLGELYCNFFHKHHSVPATIVRCFNVYGPGDLPGKYRNVIPNFIYQATLKQPLPVTGSGEETRDFTFIDDIVEGILLAGTASEAIGQTFNLGACIETEIIELADLVNKLCSNPAGVLNTPRRGWDSIARRRASIDKAKRLLGYEPRIRIEEGLMQTVHWFNANWDLIRRDARF